MNTIGLFGILSGSAVALALFLSSFFLFIKRKDNPKHLWLGMILVAVGLRVGKSIIYFLANGIAPIGLSLGFLGLSSIGPLVWFLVRGRNSLKVKDTWHFLVPIIGAISCYLVTPSPWETIIYIGGTAMLLIYLIVSWVSVINNQDKSPWDQKVLIMTTGIWLSLVYQHISNSMMDYAFGSVGASIFLYWIFYQSFRTSVFTKGIAISLPNEILTDIKEAFENKKVFKEQGINLQSFSMDLDIPSYLVTKSVKQLYHRTFPEALNHFRIEELKQMLLDPKKEHLKIESLAYEVGFASPSAFYASFKKVTGQTPTEYQKKAARMSA